MVIGGIVAICANHPGAEAALHTLEKTVRTLETHEEWIDGSRYLNMEPPRELLKKPAPDRKAA